MTKQEALFLAIGNIEEATLQQSESTECSTADIKVELEMLIKRKIELEDSVKS